MKIYHGKILRRYRVFEGKIVKISFCGYVKHTIRNILGELHFVCTDIESEKLKDQQKNNIYRSN
ncbi:hypothetical protein [Buchnera aphidicola]|uniref:Uncharacterized protein n=1 Tax=Buchnera aphidicola subsp. Uroleucon sonchi TaxID=118118 RepID=A0A6C1FB80_BUCUN|nr:hypothetical protein [Buchnera aphidicola]QIE01937.1 hypothetical protein GUU85_00950 [Buchnera aphidicola (Uroleucon sonchi)]